MEPSSHTTVQTEPNFDESEHRRRARSVTTVTVLLAFLLLIASTTLVAIVYLNDTSNGPNAAQLDEAESALSIARESNSELTNQAQQLAANLNTGLATGGIGFGEQGLGPFESFVEQRLDDAIRLVEQSRAGVSLAYEQVRGVREEVRGADDAYHRRWTAYWILYGAFVVATISVASAIVTYSRHEARRQFQNDQLKRRLAAGADEFDIRQMLQHNRAQLQGYHAIISNFATSSRQLAIRAIGVGFGFTILVSSTALLVDGIAGAISASVVAASAAGLTGFIGSAIIKNTATSSNEMMASFKHPIDTERVLTAERIIASLPVEEKVTATMLLVGYLTDRSVDTAKGGGS